MRPLELRIRNFRSYFGDDVEFDFRERRLVGIVGPIGSGKSSILDAISFALYNRTSDVGSATKTLIHQRADNAAVSFRFEVDGDVWEVQRLLRRKGQSQHALYRLEKDADGADKVEQVLQEGPVNDKVAELVGLDFDAFSRSVLLAQGRFAEFLTAPPRTRDKVLKSVFGYDRVDRMREAAKAMKQHSEIEAEKAAIRVQNLVDLEAQNEARREDRGREVERLEVLEKAAPELAELVEAGQEMNDRLTRAAAELDELDAVAEMLPDQLEADDLVAKAETAAAARTSAAEALVSARSDVAHATKELDRLEQGGERTTLEQGATLLAVRNGHAATRDEADTRRVQAQQRLERAEVDIVALRDGVAAIELARTAGEEAFAAVEEQFREADDRYHEATHRNMAVTLKLDLKVGERCPVCEHDVDALPDIERAPDLEHAADLLTDAKRRRGEAEQQRSEAAAKLGSAQAELDAAATRVTQARGDAEQTAAGFDRADERLRRADEQIESLLGDGDAAANLDKRREVFEAVVVTAAAATRSYERAREDHDEAIRGEQAAERNVADLRMRLAQVGGSLGGEPVATEPVAEAVAGVRKRVDEARSSTRGVVGKTTRALTGVEQEQRALLLRIEIEGDFSEELASVRARVDVIGEEIARADRKLAGADAAVAERDRLTARRDDFAKLAADFTDARFVRFLLDDERVRLGELGSEQFQRLTDGRYRFSDDGAFDVVDLAAADSVRKASSLSGGETFLASLALALALAEMVSRTGGRLDAFFLDEGFGTLDPEHLDLAMEGVESLVAEDGSRLVVVVSHVAELRHRIEDLIELDRHPVTGDTKVVRA